MQGQAPGRALGVATSRVHVAKTCRALCTGPSRVHVAKAADGIHTVTMKRSDKLNALDMGMFRSLAATARALASDSSVRAVVISGEGRAFCAGLDVRSVASPMVARANLEELLRRPEGELSNLAQDVGYLWRKIPAPVIAATHGVCLGGGLQIALGADMRISDPRCKFSVMEAKWGLIPDMSATVTLRELVPKDVAMELTMTGRIFLADEALKLGLVTRLAHEPLEAAMELARQIVTRSPDASAAAKRLLHATYSEGCDERRALHLESELQRRLLGGWNQMASAAKGLGVPKAFQLGYRARDDAWLDEADDEAQAELVRMLEGSELKGASMAARANA